MKASDHVKMKKRRLSLKNKAGTPKVKRKSSPDVVYSLQIKDDIGRGLHTDDVEGYDTIDPYDGDAGDEELSLHGGELEDDNTVDPYEGDEEDDDDSGDSENMEDDEKKADVGDAEEDDEKGDVENIDHDDKMKYLKQRITHGYHLVQGKMDHGMEDYIVAKSRKMHGFQLGLYAIFDGHSGRNVAQYLQSHLFDNILSEDEFWKNPKSAVKRAYEVTDGNILENVEGSRGGSTAVTTILIDGKKLVVANVGDSRAVLCRKGKAKQITVDHEPKEEKSLVESRGGFVSQKPGNVPRVDGQLAMTRAFGDGRLKDHITAEPDVMIETVNKDTQFIILASDGLWKVMSNQEACDCIGEFKNAQDASEELIREALCRKSLDDISCIVVMFH